MFSAGVPKKQLKGKKIIPAALREMEQSGQEVQDSEQHDSFKAKMLWETFQAAEVVSMRCCFPQLLLLLGVCRTANRLSSATNHLMCHRLSSPELLSEVSFYCSYIRLRYVND